MTFSIEKRRLKADCSTFSLYRERLSLASKVGGSGWMRYLSFMCLWIDLDVMDKLDSDLALIAWFIRNSLECLFTSNSKFSIAL